MVDPTSQLLTEDERVIRDQMIRARTCPRCGGQLIRRVCVQHGACGTDWSNIRLTKVEAN